MLDMIDITIDRARLRVWANENRIEPDHAAALTNDLDLFVGDVALDVVKLSRVGVRNNERFARQIDNVLESPWVNVRKIDEDAEPLALAHQVAAEICQAVAWRTARLENPAAARGVAPRMRQANRSHAELVKCAEQV